MASTTPSDDQKLRKPNMIQRRPMMLKDYLRDDLLSSCSSNGFKSFPRRQCCITVRFLLEVDLKVSTKQRLLRRSRSKAAASTTISALQRTSEAVISAVKKQLPFHSVKSPSERNGGKKGVLVPRSLSRKLFFRRSFWRKADKGDSDIRRWRLFRDILNEQDKPSDRDAHHSSTTIVGSRVSTSTGSSSNGDSWAESEFTSEILRSSSGKSESSSENEGKSDLPEREISKSIGQTVGEDSILEATATTTSSGANTKEWSNEEEKEQFSPVSVLDCPFEDDEDNSSPFQNNLACIEGTKQKLMHKIRRFECLAQLEPVDLEKRIALSELNHEPPQSPMQPCSMSTQDNNTFGNKEENQTEQKAQELLDLINTTSSLNGAKFREHNLLLDFFWERIEENNASASTTRGCIGFERELLKVAEDWLNGNPQELMLGWEVQDGRKVYLRDMDKGGKWRILVEEKEEVGLDIEFEVWISLLNELVLDLSSSIDECFGKSLAE